MNRVLIALLLSGSTLAAQAGTIYKCTTADGGTLISNNRVDKSCKAVVSGPDNALPSPPKGKSTSATANPSPASFPKVTEDTQKARDKDRKHILEEELAGEQKKLEQAKKELAEQEALRPTDRNAPKAAERIQPYKERVAQHERNITAINKELSNLK